MNAKELLEKVKDKFNTLFPVVAPAAAAAPVAKTYKLQDGTEISVSQAGDVPAVGDAVTVNGQPAPDQEWCLEDGTCITTVGGMITVCTPPAPATQPAATDTTEPLDLSLEQRVAKCEAMLGEMKASIDQFIQMQAAQPSQYEAVAKVANDAKAEVEKYKEIIKDQFELIEKIAEQPSATPATATGKRKDRIENEEQKKEEKFKKMGDMLKKLKAEAQ